MKLHVFCFDLPQSDACFIKAYPAETTEAFFDLASPKAIETCAAHWRAASEVIVVDPEGGSDLNDELRGAAA